MQLRSSTKYAYRSTTGDVPKVPGIKYDMISYSSTASTLTYQVKYIKVSCCALLVLYQGSCTFVGVPVLFLLQISSLRGLVMSCSATVGYYSKWTVRWAPLFQTLSPSSLDPESSSHAT